MANQESKQPVYKDHLTAWRPDYPVMWNITIFGDCADLKNEPKGISSKHIRDRNINSFTTARNAIAKCIGQC